MSPSLWRSRVGSMLAFVVVAGSLLWYVGVLPDNAVLAGAVMLLLTSVTGLLWWSHADLSAEVEPVSWHATLGQDSTGPMALDYRLVRLRRDLRDALERSDREDAIHALVCDLAVGRLQARHGVDARSDPQRARQVLGPAVWDYLTTPPVGTARRSARELGRVLDRLEEL